MIFFISSILIQAYRLEPLISPIYAQVKPVKMDTASSKLTQKSMSLAEGPKTPEGTHNTKSSSSSWTQSLISAEVKTVASNNAAETSKSLPPDKVSYQRNISTYIILE